MTAESVPGPRWHPPLDLPHVLVVTGGRGYEKDYEVEHPPECARSCPWWPAGGSTDALGDVLSMLTYGVERGEPDCYVGWEISNAGLESLSGELDGRPVDGRDWRELPAGRYRIAGWYQPPGWAGSTPLDADGGISFLSRERPRWYDVLRPRAVPSWPYRLRYACLRGVRVRRLGRVCLRGPKNRAYFSERNRHGCRVLPLAGGWRLVLEHPRKRP